MGTNRKPELILYGQAGTTKVIETTTELSEQPVWQATYEVVMTNLFQSFACEGITNRTMFYRARRN